MTDICGAVFGRAFYFCVSDLKDVGNQIKFKHITEEKNQSHSEGINPCELYLLIIILKLFYFCIRSKN